MTTRIFLALAALLVSANAHAAFIFTSTLSGDQEVDPTGSTATGFASLSLNDEQTRLEIMITIEGLDLDGLQTEAENDNVSGLHIHRGPAGVNGPVIFGFIGPNSDLNGDLMIDPAAGTIFSAWDAEEGNGTTLLDELENLFADGLYLNVHTPDFPGGEIRGQILAVDDNGNGNGEVPEPASLGLLGLGLALLGFARRRQAAR